MLAEANCDLAAVPASTFSRGFDKSRGDTAPTPINSDARSHERLVRAHHTKRTSPICLPSTAAGLNARRLLSNKTNQRNERTEREIALALPSRTQAPHDPPIAKRVHSRATNKHQ